MEIFRPEVKDWKKVWFFSPTHVQYILQFLLYFMTTPNGNCHELESFLNTAYNPHRSFETINKLLDENLRLGETIKIEINIENGKKITLSSSLLPLDLKFPHKTNIFSFNI